MPTNVRSVVLLAAVLVACHRPVEMRGLYVAYDRTGAFVPCDQPDIILIVRDSALAVRYRLEATQPYERLFVRLVGVRTDSGSIYGGAHHFLVRQILEIRSRQPGDCPRLARPVPLTLRARLVSPD